MLLLSGISGISSSVGHLLVILLGSLLPPPSVLGPSQCSIIPPAPWIVMVYVQLFPKSARPWPPWGRGLSLYLPSAAPVSVLRVAGRRCPMDLCQMGEWIPESQRELLLQGGGVSWKEFCHQILSSGSTCPVWYYAENINTFLKNKSNKLLFWTQAEANIQCHTICWARWKFRVLEPLWRGLFSPLPGLALGVNTNVHA